MPSVSATRGVYRSTYTRPPVRYSYRTARPAIAQPVVPAGRGPGGAGLAAAILGPIGGLTGCLCCLNTLAIWGLFITAIPLAVFLCKYIRRICFLALVINLFKLDGCLILRLVTV